MLLADPPGVAQQQFQKIRLLQIYDKVSNKRYIGNKEQISIKSPFLRLVKPDGIFFWRTLKVRVNVARF